MFEIQIKIQQETELFFLSLQLNSKMNVRVEKTNAEDLTQPYFFLINFDSG